MFVNSSPKQDSRGLGVYSQKGPLSLQPHKNYTAESFDFVDKIFIANIWRLLYTQKIKYL